MPDESQIPQEPFVELNRRFRKLGENGKAEETAFESYTKLKFGYERNLNWDELLKEARVVVLGEPGSGKSWELKRRVGSLSKSGEFAFFIRLDQLVERGLQSLWGTDEQAQFR